MQCHEPGHRAPARCVSALLAAGALLATVADHLAGMPERPAVQAAALAVPDPDTRNASGEPVRPSPGMADPLASWTAPAPEARKARLSMLAGRAAKPPVWRLGTVKSRPASKRPASGFKSRWASRGRPSSNRRASAYLLAHLPPATNQKAAAAVHEALLLLGVPYRWGGTTRAGGFDCSGFTQHIWAAAGVKIPRTVRAQARAGTHISLNKAQPGDLVVFYPTQHHVGVFVGNGLVIDSPHTGSSVRPDPVRSMPVSVVVRVKD
jgi:cell wall-associated NlpC family hydrolase